MRSTRVMVAVSALALLAGCGDRRLVLDIDVLSYLDPSTTQETVGPVPAVPGGLVSGEKAVVSNESIHLLDGVSSAIKVESVSFALAAVVTDSTGSGSDTLRVYLSPAGQDPMTTPPVVEAPIVMSPGATDTVTVAVDGDQRVNDLFAGHDVQLSFTTSLRGPGSGPALNGRFALTQLRATVVGGRSGW